MSETAKLFLVKYAELTLRKENKRQFEMALERNIRNALGTAPARVWRRHGRLFVEAAAEGVERAEKVLSSTFGLGSYASAEAGEKNIAAVEAAALRVAASHAAGARDFKIEARRLDKSFPLSSYEIACRLGDRVREAFPALRVNVRKPELTIQVEIREHAYVYGPEEPGLRGLPLGTSGSGLLLLSGGIDSPVAGYLMGSRGLRLDAVYFHAPPYTAEEAHGKVVDLCRALQPYLPGLGLWTVPFTAIQERIRERGAPRETTLHMRACMMRIADTMAQRAGCQALVTGESLGQVASQTPQSIRFTGGSLGLPVFRPLIAIEKDEIIRTAKRIGTYEISIRPYDDCCTVFAPSRPLIKPLHDGIVRAFAALEMGSLMEQAARDAVWTDLAG
jgi:tRNA uracil 4-sulfurtransferase